MTDVPDPINAEIAAGLGVDTAGDWTGRLPKEDGATRRHRIAQGLWRTDVAEWPCGEPQDDQRVRARYPTLPNWLNHTHNGVDVRDAGVNIMSPEAREYARDRLAILNRIDGKAEPDRLWRNLLSSQPLAFSIAGHLRRHPTEAAALLRSMTGLPIVGLADLDPGRDEWADYALGGVEAEWFPPRVAHTEDLSGCDIACCVEVSGGRRFLVTIEVKYTDSFSRKPVDWARYASHLTALGLDQEATEALVGAGCSQVLRQVMITDSVRRRGLVPDAGPDGRVDGAIAVIFARGNDSKARDVVNVLHQAVGDRIPVQFWSHNDLLAEAGTVPGLRAWADGMALRYLPS